MRRSTALQSLIKVSIKEWRPKDAISRVKNPGRRIKRDIPIYSNSIHGRRIEEAVLLCSPAPVHGPIASLHVMVDDQA